MTNFDDVYMGTAFLHARKSKAIRAKVGAVIVTKTGVIIPGYNGSPSGTDNECENKVWNPDTREYILETKPEILHAELNCLLKAAKEGIAIQDAILYVTLAPCIQCSAMIKQVGIREVVYNDDYRIMDGVKYLKRYGVTVRKMNETTEEEKVTA